MKKKTLATMLITIAIIIVAAVLVVMIVIPAVIDKKAEQLVGERINSTILEMGISENISYENLEVQSAQGAIVFTNFSFAGSEIDMTSDTLTIQVPPTQAIRFARNPEEGYFDNATITAEGFMGIIPDTGSSISASKIAVSADGYFPGTGIFPEANAEADLSEITISDLSIAIEDILLELPDASGSVSVDSYELSMSGDFTTTAGEEFNIIEMMNDADTSQGSISGVVVNLGDEIQNSMVTMANFLFGSGDILADDENWQVRTASFDISHNESSANLNSFELETPFITLDANASSVLDDQGIPVPPFSGEVHVTSLDAELRPLFEMIAQGLTDSPLPEGDTFSMRISLDTEGEEPTIEFFE